MPRRRKLEFDAPPDRAAAPLAAGRRRDVPLAISCTRKAVRTLADGIAAAVYRRAAQRDASASRCATCPLRRAQARPQPRRQARCAAPSTPRSPTRPASLRSSAGAQARQAKVTADDLARRYRDRHHRRPRALQAAAVQALKFSQALRRRRRPARLPDPDRPLLDHRQAGQPGLDGAELARGPASCRHRRSPGGAPRTRCSARWMGIANGVGIHGTGEDYSIGIARLARLHPHARLRRDRPLSARAGRHAVLLA